MTIIDGTIAELELVDYGPPDTYIVIREIEEEKLVSTFTLSLSLTMYAVNSPVPIHFHEVDVFFLVC